MSAQPRVLPPGLDHRIVVRKVAGAGAASAAAADELSFHFKAMASDCELRLPGLPQAQALALAQRAIAEVRRIETTYSRFRGDSETSRINAAAGTSRPVAVDGETEHLLAFADHWHRHSEGLFDPSSGVLRRVWDFRAARRPAPAELAALLPLIGWQQVQWQGGLVRLPKRGMELDFGAMGKEYAADRAAHLLRKMGVSAGLVRLGGDVRVVGPRPDGRAWTHAIPHPRQPGLWLSAVALQDGALASTSDHERFFERDGQRFCHVLNPLTGQPAGWPAAPWQSISVLAPDCLTAGALCTVAMLKGEQALDFLDREQVDYLAVDDRGRVHRPAALIRSLPLAELRA